MAEGQSLCKQELIIFVWQWPVLSGRKNGFFQGNKRIILGESAVVSRGLVRLCLDFASLMQRQSYYF
jgi:hypothetical protein